MTFFIIDSVVELCDRAAAALDRRELGRRRFFEDHAQPIFEQMLRVHEDYMQAFIDVARIIADEATTPENVLDTLATKRDVYDHLRRLIWDLYVRLLTPKYVGVRPTAKQLRNRALRRKEAAYMFVSAISKYFQCCSTYPPFLRRGSTVFAGLVNLVEIWARGEFTRVECANAMGEQRKVLRRRWADVSRTYAELRAICLA